MRAIHKTYGLCLVSREDWNTSAPMITAVFKTPVYLPRQGYRSILTVGKGALKGERPSVGYRRPHRVKSLAEKYLPMMNRIVWEMKTDYDSFDDLQLVALEGLVQAANKYDESVGSFQAYATPRIRGAIKDHWRNTINEEETKADGFWNTLADVDDDRDQKRMLRDVREVLPKLSRRKRRLIEARYLADNPMPWPELASEFRLSKRQLMRLRDEAIAALKGELL